MAKTSTSIVYYFVALEERNVDSGIGAGIPLDDTDLANANNIDTSIPGENDELEYPIEHQDGFEGDIYLNAEQATIIENGTEEDLRSASTISSHKWPKSGVNVHIPYLISSSFDASDRANIAKVFKEYESKTCLRYKQYNIVAIAFMSYFRFAPHKYIYTITICIFSEWLQGQQREITLICLREADAGHMLVVREAPRSSH